MPQAARKEGTTGRAQDKESKRARGSMVYPLSTLISLLILFIVASEQAPCHALNADGEYLA